MLNTGVQEEAGKQRFCFSILTSRQQKDRPRRPWRPTTGTCPPGQDSFQAQIRKSAREPQTTQRASSAEMAKSRANRNGDTDHEHSNGFSARQEAARSHLHGGCEWCYHPISSDLTEAQVNNS